MYFGNLCSTLYNVHPFPNKLHILIYLRFILCLLITFITPTTIMSIITTTSPNTTTSPTIFPNSLTLFANSLSLIKSFNLLSSTITIPLGTFNTDLTVLSSLSPIIINNFTKCVSSAYPSLGNIEIHPGEEIKPKK